MVPFYNCAEQENTSKYTSSQTAKSVVYTGRGTDSPKAVRAEGGLII